MTRSLSLGAMLLAASIAQAQDSHSPAWVSQALAYERVDAQLFLATEKAQTVASLARLREAAERVKAVQVSDEALLAALTSSDTAVREAAAIVAFVQDRASAAIVDAVIRSYDPTAAFFTRYYAIRVLAASAPWLIRERSAAVADLFAREQNEVIRRDALVLEAELERDDAIRMLAEYVATGSPALARLAPLYAARRGPPAVAALTEAVESRGAARALAAATAASTGKPQTAAERDAIAIPVIEAYVARTRGWPRKAYAIGYSEERRGLLTYDVSHADDLKRPANTTGADKSFAAEFDPAIRQVVRELWFQ